MADGMVSAGCAGLPSATPNQVIPLSPTCNLEVRVGTSEEGSYLAARTAGLWCAPPTDTGAPGNNFNALVIQTTETTARCGYNESCDTYTEGLPGQPLVRWSQITAPGSLVSASVFFPYYDQPYVRIVTVYPALAECSGSFGQVSCLE